MPKRTHNKHTQYINFDTCGFGGAGQSCITGHTQSAFSKVFSGSLRGYMKKQSELLTPVLSAWVIAAMVLSLAGVNSSPAFAVTTTVTLEASKDAYVQQDKPTENFGDATEMKVNSRSGSKNKRALVEFSVTSLPAGATIESATLTLYLNNAPHSSRTYNAHRITSSWIEGNGETNDNPVDEVRWNNQPATTTSETSATSTGTTKDVYRSWDVTSDVQAFVNGSANYGWLIKDASENSVSEDLEGRFRTREYATSSERPKLVVVYSIVPTTATLTLVKQVTNDNGGGAAITAWTLSASGPTPISGVSGNGAVTNAVVNLGSYDLSESGGPSGYLASVWICTGTGTQDDSDTVTLTAGQNATCTITNDDIAPTLTLVKAVVNDNGGTAAVSDFPLFVNVTPVASSATSTLSANILYTASETTQTGYAPSSWGGDCAANGTITLQPGDVKICTITNDDIQPKLTVTKVVINDDTGTKSVADFPLLVGATSVTSGTETGFNAGTYTVSETGDANYTKIISGDCALDGSITLALGDVKSCTITNDDNVVVLPPTEDTLAFCSDGIDNDDNGFTDLADPDCAGYTPKLTVTKVVVNDNGGTLLAADVPLFVDGSSVTTGVQNTFSVGTSTVSETSQTGYTGVISGDCATDGTVALAIGSIKSCTITNDDIAPSLTLNKVVVNDNDGIASTTDWTVTATGSTSISGAGATSSDATFSAGTYTLSESGPANYTASAWSCTNEVTVGEGNTITLGLGQSTTCTITNDDIAPPDITAPTTLISSPSEGSVFEADSIAITGTTTDASGTASTTLAFTAYTAGEEVDCGTYTDITTLDNASQSTQFDWSYNWTPADGVYCITAHGRDIFGNVEASPVVKNVTFKKLIPPVTPPVTTSGGGGGGGGGGGTQFIFTFESATTTDNSATVNWNTNYNSSSRVVYDTVPHGLSGAMPNHDYAFSTSTFDPAGVTHHSVGISGLTPGTLYYFRLISNDILDASEHSMVTTSSTPVVTTVTTPPGGENPPAGGPTGGNTPPRTATLPRVTPPTPPTGGGIAGAGTSTNELATGGGTTTEPVVASTGNENTGTSTPPGPGLLASAIGLFNFGANSLLTNSILIFLLLLLLAYIVYRIIKRLNKES